MEAYRKDLLERLVLNRIANRKQPYSSYRRLLSTSQSHGLLKIFWKESCHITEQELDSAGMAKIFTSNSFTHHGLAVKLAGTHPELVSAYTTQIRSLKIASCAFELIHRIEHSSTRIDFHATELLHEYTIQLGTCYSDLFRKITPLNTDLCGQ